ncbi:MAG: FAD-dependent oxidoreductase [Pseudomonadota bacterium]
MGGVSRATRRRLVEAMTGGAALQLLGACTGAGQRGRAHYVRAHSRRPFVAPRVSAERIVRVIAGLRPYRPSGFVVRRERLDHKILVHNYGHGGGGISLSWGSSALAVREVRGEAPAQAAVIGAGVMGLTTARLLQDAGWQVTLYTAQMPRHTTSNIAAGQWGPTSVFELTRVDPAFEARYQWAARISHHAFQNLVGPRYGVRFLENYYLGDRPHEPSYYARELPELFAEMSDLLPGEHPFPVPHVHRTVTMQIEPAIFLRQLEADIRLAGGRFVVRAFESPQELLALPEQTLFNCTGLGSRELFNDVELTPAKGQLVFVLPDQQVDFATIGGGRGVRYMFPRTGELVLGGSWERGEFSLATDVGLAEQIVADHKALFDAMEV